MHFGERNFQDKKEYVASLKFLSLPFGVRNKANVQDTHDVEAMTDFITELVTSSFDVFCT